MVLNCPWWKEVGLWSGGREDETTRWSRREGVASTQGQVQLKKCHCAHRLDLTNNPLSHDRSKPAVIWKCSHTYDRIWNTDQTWFISFLDLQHLKIKQNVHHSLINRIKQNVLKDVLSLKLMTFWFLWWLSAVSLSCFQPKASLSRDPNHGEAERAGTHASHTCSFTLKSWVVGARNCVPSIHIPIHAHGNAFLQTIN